VKETGQQRLYNMKYNSRKKAFLRAMSQTVRRTEDAGQFAAITQWFILLLRLCAVLSGRIAQTTRVCRCFDPDTNQHKLPPTTGFMQWHPLFTGSTTNLSRTYAMVSFICRINNGSQQDLCNGILYLPDQQRILNG
jgi:hypothetical protein